MSKVAQVAAESLESEVLRAPGPVLVDFYATWCGPCRALAPVVEEIAREKGGALKVVKVDVDDAQEAAASLGVLSVPTLVLFRGGREVWRHVGAAPKAALLREIDPHLKA